MGDSLYAGRRVAVKSNSNQVGKIEWIARELNLEAATPFEIREISGLKPPALKELW